MISEGQDSGQSIKTPHTATWRNVSGPFELKLWNILTRHRNPEEIANIERLLNKCRDPSQAIIQWARANVPNIAIGPELVRLLGDDDPSVIKHRAALQRHSQRRHNHLIWP